MYEYKAKLNRVVDGDSLRLDIDLGFGVWKMNENARLHHVDTPESRTRDLLEKHFGKLAEAYTANKVENAQSLTIKTSVDKTGKFGRLLVVVYCDDETVSLNDQLIEQRLAVKYEGQSKTDVEVAHITNMIYLVENDIVQLPTELVPLYESK